MAEYGLGEGDIVVPRSPYFAVVNVRIEPASASQASSDDDAQADDKDEEKVSTSGSFKTEDVIELSSADNNYILEFSTKVVSEDGSSDVEDDITISIVDRTGAIIDSILGQVRTDSVVTYSYGYAYGVMSDEIQATLKSYGSTITPQGERIDIMLTTIADSSSDSVDSKDTGTYTGATSDIVKQIAEEEGWELGDIEPTTLPTKITTTTVASEDQKKQQQEFMNDYNTRMKDPAKWFAQQQKKREEEKKKNEFNADDLLNPGNVLKKN